jgi:uncharacterized protein (DUF2384 family)
MGTTTFISSPGVFMKDTQSRYLKKANELLQNGNECEKFLLRPVPIQEERKLW